MATTFGSSASHGVPKRLRPDLPLIACSKCGQKIVKEYRVKEYRVKKKGINQGRIFYTCSDCKVSYFFCHVLL